MATWFDGLRENQRSEQWAQRARNERRRQCLETSRLLQRYLDRDLDPSELAAFERHLEGCRQCSLETRTYLEIKDVLAGRRRNQDCAAASRLREFAMGLRYDL